MPFDDEVKEEIQELVKTEVTRALRVIMGALDQTLKWPARNVLTAIKDALKREGMI